MLDQFLGKLDTKMYPKWQEYADAVLTEIQQALSKMHFEPPLPEIEAIQARLPLSTELSRKEYGQGVQFIQEKIILLTTKKDFNNTQINDFFFQAYRSLNSLNGFVSTKLAPYGEAFFNPSRKSSEEEGGIQKKVLSKAASVTRNIFLDALKDNIAFLHAQGQKIPLKAVVEKVDDLSPPAPILAGMALSPSQIEQLNPTQTLDDPQAVFPFLTEKIYTFAFDSNYMHVAKLCEIQSKIEKIIAEKSKTPQELEKIKREELAKLGLASLSTSQTRLYLDNIAKNLGFENAAELYHHYCNISQKEHFDAFKEKRSQFIGFANQDSSREADPLEKIKSDAFQEYQRVKNLSSDEDNATYCTLLAYYGSDNVGNIEVKQRLNNLGKIASQDHLPSLLSHLPKYATPLARLASWLINVPEKLNTQFLGDLYTENDLLQKRLDNACLPLNQAWVQFNESKINEHEKNAARFFKMIQTSSREKIIAKLTVKQAEIKRETSIIAQANRKLSHATLSSKDRSRLESIVILSTGELEAKETNYLTLKAMFDYEADKQLWETPFEKLEGTVTELDNEKDQFVIQAEAQLHEKQRVYHAKESSFIGRIILFRDKIATVFNIQTETMRVREETLLRFKEEETKINTAENIYKERIHAAVSQQSLYHKLANTDPSSLASKILLWQEEYLRIKHDDDPTNLRKSYELNKQKLLLENQLKMALSLFVEKKELPLESLEIQALLARVQETISVLSNTAQKGSPLLSHFQAMEDKLKNKLLEHKKMRQGDKIKSLQTQFNERLAALSFPEIKNPFHLVSTEEIEVKVSLYEHIAARYAEQLDTSSSDLTKKQLEDLFYTFKQGYYYHIEQAGTEHKKMARLYEDLAQKIESLIEKRYEQLHTLLPQEQKAALETLDAEFLHHLDNLSEKTNVVEYAQVTYHAPWNIGYFFCSDATLLEVNSALAAARDQCLLFSRKYRDFLEKYNAKSYFDTLDSATLSAHIARLNAHIGEIRILATQSKDPLLQDILFHYDAILQTAQQAQESEDKIKALESAYSAFAKKSEEMLNGVRDGQRFDTEKYNRLKEGMKNLAKMLESKQAQLHGTEKEKYLSLLDDLSIKLDSLIRRVSPLFEFYANIATKKHQAFTIPSLAPEYLGKGFVLAVQVNNERAIEALLAAPSPLPIQDLAAASKLAASEGHLEVVKKIHQHRQDIAFTQNHLFESIKAALSKGHTSIAYYLILEMPYEPNNESSEFLQAHLVSPTSQLSPIPKGFRQLLVDSDGPTLERLRACFTCEEALLTATPTSIERLEKIKNIREKMVSYYARYPFDNVDRKNEALKKWHEEMTALEEAYRNKVAPPSLVAAEEKEESREKSENTESLTFESAKNTFMAVIEDKKWEPSRFHAALSHLRYLTNNQNKALFYRALSEAINYTARHDKEEALAMLLVQIEDPMHKKELASNALFEALSEGSIHAIDYLMSEKAYEGKEPQFVEALFKIKQEKANGQNQARHIYLPRLAETFLSHMPVAFDGRIQSIIQQVIDKKASSDVPPVEQGYFQWARDKDYPFLEEIREIYLFSEKVYKDTSMKLFVDLRSRLDDKLGEKELKDFSAEEIKEWEFAYHTAQAQVAHQQRTLENLRNACIERATIENKERMQKNINSWEEALQPSKDNIEDDLRYIEKHIHAYQQTVERSQAIVFSQTKETGQRLKEEKAMPLPPQPEAHQRPHL